MSCTRLMLQSGQVFLRLVVDPPAGAARVKSTGCSAPFHTPLPLNHNSGVWCACSQCYTDNSSVCLPPVSCLEWAHKQHSYLQLKLIKGTVFQITCIPLCSQTLTLFKKNKKQFYPNVMQQGFPDPVSYLFTSN